MTSTTSGLLECSHVFLFQQDKILVSGMNPGLQMENTLAASPTQPPSQPLSHMHTQEAWEKSQLGEADPLPVSARFSSRELILTALFWFGLCHSLTDLLT